MNENEGRQAQVVEDESGDRPEKVPLTARLLLRESLTARRAAGIIAGFTVLITVAGGILKRVIDHQEFPTIGRGLWFALQTVTTAGYGDVTRRQADGRFIGAVVMLTGIGFLALITASVTASLVESSRRRFATRSELDVTRRRRRSANDWRGSKRRSISRRQGGNDGVSQSDQRDSAGAKRGAALAEPHRAGVLRVARACADRLSGS